MGYYLGRPMTEAEREQLAALVSFAQREASAYGGHRNAHLAAYATDLFAVARTVRQWMDSLQPSASKPLDVIIQEVVEWQQATFADGSEEGRIAHWKEEIGEWLANLSSGEEATDVFFLFVALYHNRGINLAAESERKLEINKKRQWAKSESGYSKHVEDGRDALRP